MEENKELQNQNQEPEKNREQVENTQNADNAAQENASQQPKIPESEDVTDKNQSENQPPDSESTEQQTSQDQEGEVTSEAPEETTAESSPKQPSKENESKGEEAETAQKEDVPEPESFKAQEKTEPGVEDKTNSGSDEKIELEQDEDIYDIDLHKLPEHDDDTEEDDDRQEINEDFFLSKSREELLDMLKEVVQEDNVNKVKNKIALIRSAFIQKTKEKKQEDYENFVQKGAEDEEFVEQADELENQFNDVFSVYRKKKAEYNRRQEEQKKLNLEKKNEILEKLRNLINSEEPLKKTYDEFRALQAEWRETGMVPRGEVNELWRNYHFLVEKFFDKVKINQELRDLGLRKNLQKKIELCEKAEELLLEENINKSFKLLQKYHEKWREIGPVPQDKNEKTWQRFKSATDKINERRREHYDQQNEQQEENYKAKLALCEKADALLAEERNSVKDWLNATDRINELFKLWRSIGRAPGKQNDEVWNRFKSTLDKFFSVKKAFFKELKDQQKENYNKKLEIIEQAEALKDSEDWKGTKNELINLQKKWKSIGPVPRKHSNKIWKRFRTACDHFFNRRDKYFKNIHQHEEENLKKKQEVLDKIKAFELSGDKRKDLDALKEFQREWSEIGFVPIKKKDAIQKEYKEALDKHFNALDVSTAEKNVMNYKQKLENIKEDPNANQRIGKERSFLMNKISKMEEDLLLWENNVGFLSDSKKSNQLRDEFEKKIEKHKHELSVLKTKLRYLDKTEDEQ